MHACTHERSPGGSASVSRASVETPIRGGRTVCATEQVRVILNVAHKVVTVVPDRYANQMPIELAGHASRVEINVRRPSAASAGAEEEEWFIANIHLTTGAFTGQLNANFQYEDLADFRRQLSDMVVGSTQSATLSPIEDAFFIELKKGATGVIVVQVRVSVSVDVIVNLSAQFDSDVSYLRKTLGELDAWLLDPAESEH